MRSRVNEVALKKYVKRQGEAEKTNQLNYLDIVTKFIAISSVAGLIAGCFIAFFYLKNIHQLSVFPEVMSEPSSLIAVLVVMAVFILYIFIGFLVPYIFILFQDDIKNIIDVSKNFNSIVRNILILLIMFSVMIILYFLWNFLTFLQDELNISLRNLLSWSVISILCLYVVFVLYRIIGVYRVICVEKTFKLSDVFKKILSVFWEGMQFVLIIVFSLYPVFFLLFLMNGTWLSEGGHEIWFLLMLLGILAVINNGFAMEYSRLFSNQKINKFIWVVPLLCAIFLLFFIIVLTNDFSARILSIPRFIERPQQASWYLLYHQWHKSDDIQEYSGINPCDMKKIKQNFRNDERRYYTEERYESLNFANRNNALYGYMAWNLGSTKVFCPTSVDNIKINNHQDFNKCLVIDGRFLQILDEQYIDASDSGQPQDGSGRCEKNS